MKRLKETAEIKDFLDEVRKCDDEVWFKTTQGDLLNLKSELSQFVFVTMAVRPKIIDDAAIECKDAADEERLSRFLEDA